MATSAQFAAKGWPRRRKNQFRTVPKKKAMAVPISGPRKKAMALPVRSRKWPRERVYTSGFWLRASKMSEPEGGGGGGAARKPVAAAMSRPSERRTEAERRPARASGEAKGASDSRA